MTREGVPLNVIQRQLGDANRRLTTGEEVARENVTVALLASPDEPRAFRKRQDT